MNKSTHPLILAYGFTLLAVAVGIYTIATAPKGSSLAQIVFLTGAAIYMAWVGYFYRWMKSGPAPDSLSDHQQYLLTRYTLTTIFLTSTLLVILGGPPVAAVLVGDSSIFMRAVVGNWFAFSVVLVLVVSGLISTVSKLRHLKRELEFMKKWRR